MATRSSERAFGAWREELLRKLEAVHALAIEAEAFHTALDEFFSRGAGGITGDLERRRDLNRMTCFIDHLGKTISALLDESEEVVQLATSRHDVGCQTGRL